ncbi:MAG: phosphoribosylformimino-5-aminoimidazole carboxamide ribotide isomerase [Clostridiales bacterium]|jgi:phosphoribosylformimino-5-aminoimidazole carboxamide ribotide isomerase|nr:phosphoribosylformimino-5-aminoimidazole carboxamide ribotide isomerase [Clostridiales bacterium]
MIIYPAIDLLGGRCVRLKQGDYNQVTVYSEDPLEMARSFAAAGAEWIHIVDLDAAKTGAPVHADIIRRIRRETGIRVQTGGGIRNMSHLSTLIDEYDIDRAVLGTAAVNDRAFTTEALNNYNEKIAIGIDARSGEVSVSGWTKGSGIKASELAFKMAEAGAKTIIFTDIARDGMLTGPAIESTSELVKLTGIDIIASGGIGSYADIEAVRSSGAAGVIVGKAIYEGKVKLEQCWPRE